MALSDLPVLLRDEPAMLKVLGRSAAVLAVPEAARPLTLAGLATVGSRQPLLVAVPTTAEADRLSLPNNLMFARMRMGGRPGRVPTMAEAEAHAWTDAERAFVVERNAQQAIGDLELATSRISALIASTQANEVIVVPQGPDLETKLRTLRELAA